MLSGFVWNPLCEDEKMKTSNGDETFIHELNSASKDTIERLDKSDENDDKDIHVEDGDDLQ